MTDTQMEVESGFKLITCILPKGRARPLQRLLTTEHQLYTGNFHYGRGVGRESHIRDRGIGEQQEREIFDVMVPAADAERLFEMIFFEAQMNERHGGMIFITDIPRSTPLRLPELPWEED